MIDSIGIQYLKLVLRYPNISKMLESLGKNTKLFKSVFCFSVSSLDKFTVIKLSFGDNPLVSFEIFQVDKFKSYPLDATQISNYRI